MRCLPLLVLLAAGAATQAPVDRLLHEAQQAPTLEKNLQVLTDEIGGQERAQIESLIRETHLDDQMKNFGLWRDWAAGKRGRQR